MHETLVPSEVRRRGLDLVYLSVFRDFRDRKKLVNLECGWSALALFFVRKRAAPDSIGAPRHR